MLIQRIAIKYEYAREPMPLQAGSHFTCAVCGILFMKPGTVKHLYLAKFGVRNANLCASDHEAVQRFLLSVASEMDDLSG
jgi:hypothetical protein